jgi:shikimate dehydrogenase
MPSQASSEDTAAHPARYVVIGNPVAHSLSPTIHASFAAQLGERIEYGALLAPRADFAGAAHAFFASGGRGANVTLPFKVDAFRFAANASERAQLAGAVNVLIAREGGIEGDNTDGAGLVADLATNLGLELRGRRILLLGAGGAARGVVAPLLALGPTELVVANRTVPRAVDLARRFASRGRVRAVSIEQVTGAFDLVVNATSSSTHGVALALPAGLYAPGALAYDMAYGASARPFLDSALVQGAAKACDGLGMLVEQAAESYFLWRGLRPATANVLAALRVRA